MTIQDATTAKTQVSLALDVAIHVGLAILLTASCLLILRPFLPLIAWGIIIGVAAYPSFCKLQKALGGRAGLSAALFTLVLLAFLVGPAILLAGTLAGAIQTLMVHLRDGSLIVPPPPANVETWPIIGAPLSSLWGRASNDLTDTIRSFAPQIKAFLPEVVSASASIGLIVLQFILSIVVAGILLGNAEAAYELTCSLCRRIFGERGPELQQLMGSTIRSVTTGILGVALIQSVLAGIGFYAAGLPGTGLWTVLFLIAAVVQVGAIVLIPAVIYMFAIAGTTKAVIFLIWCVFVAVLDNFLKPLLLGRGVAVPIAIVFLGAIGGFVALGLIGLFVGAVVLSVGYKLGIAWLDRGIPHADET